MLARGFSCLHISDGNIRRRKRLNIRTQQNKRIYVSDKFQSEGLGRYLMEQAIAMATVRKKKYAWLGVWEKNEKAIRYYKKIGFCEIGTHTL